MTAGSQHQFGHRLPAGALRPAKKQILRAHMSALAHRFYGPEMPADYHRKLAVGIFQTRRRSAGR